MDFPLSIKLQLMIFNEISRFIIKDIEEGYYYKRL